MNKKGFTLIELIIVIAIMAILVGVLAPNLLRYIEKTNIAADLQLCDTVRTVFLTAMVDPEYNTIIMDSGSSGRNIIAFQSEMGITAHSELFIDGGIETPFGKIIAEGLGYSDVATMIGVDGLITEFRQKYKTCILTINQNDRGVFVGLGIVRDEWGADQTQYWIPETNNPYL